MILQKLMRKWWTNFWLISSTVCGMAATSWMFFAMPIQTRGCEPRQRYGTDH